MSCKGSKAAVAELKGYLKAIDDFVLSADRAQRLNLPLNICGRCLSEAQRGQGPGEAFDLVGEVGQCCHCQDFAPVVDQTVLKLYRAFHIPDAVIAEKLPRVRRKVQHLKENRPQTILNALASVIEAPRYREDDPCSED